MVHITYFSWRVHVVSSLTGGGRTLACGPCALMKHFLRLDFVHISPPLDRKPGANINIVVSKSKAKWTQTHRDITLAIMSSPLARTLYIWDLWSFQGSLHPRGSYPYKALFFGSWIISKFSGSLRLWVNVKSVTTTLELYSILMVHPLGFYQIQFLISHFFLLFPNWLISIWSRLDGLLFDFHKYWEFVFWWISRGGNHMLLWGAARGC